MNGTTLGLITILILGLITIFLFLACILASLRDRKDDGYIERLNNTINKRGKR